MLNLVVEALFEQHGEHPAVRADGRARRDQVHGVHISHRWEGRLVLLLFRPHDRFPWLVVKVDRHPRYFARLAQEEATLRLLATRPQLAGSVPRAVGRLHLPDGARALVQTGLPGAPLTAVLRRRLTQRPRTWEGDHAQLRGWFERLASWDPRPDGATLEVADGLERLADTVGNAGSRTQRWLHRLRSQADQLARIELPAVRTHGDLGPSNLLLHRGGTRLVDWEGDLGHRSPLPEMVLSLHHYVRAVPLATRRMPTRDEAIVRAFAADDPLGRLTRTTWDRLLGDMDIDTSIADLVLLATVGTLAGGNAGTAHAARGQPMWAHAATRLVVELASGAHPWPTTR